MAKSSKLNRDKTGPDVYEKITQTIVDALEAAQGPTEWPWVKAAQHGAPINIVSRKAYQGINRLVLGMMMQGGASRHWATFKQWNDAGARIVAGEKSTCVVKWTDMWVDQTTGKRVPEDTPGARKVFFPMGFLVWHAGQVTGWQEPAAAPVNELEELAAAVGADALDEIEGFVLSTGSTVKEGGQRACFIPALDEIHMPDRSRFKDTETATATQHFYGVLMHELIHWTGPKARLDRDMTGRFGSNNYAFEELVAEIGSAFLCADLGISPQPRADNASYVANWLTVLKGDKRAIFDAASLSSKAGAFLHGLQPAATAADEIEDEQLAA